MNREGIKKFLDELPDDTEIVLILSSPAGVACVATGGAPARQMILELAEMLKTGLMN